MLFLAGTSFLLILVKHLRDHTTLKQRILLEASKPFIGTLYVADRNFTFF